MLLFRSLYVSRRFLELVYSKIRCFGILLTKMNALKQPEVLMLYPETDPHLISLILKCTAVCDFEILHRNPDLSNP